MNKKSQHPPKYKFVTLQTCRPVIIKPLNNQTDFALKLLLFLPKHCNFPWDFFGNSIIKIFFHMTPGSRSVFIFVTKSYFSKNADISKTMISKVSKLFTISYLSNKWPTVSVLYFVYIYGNFLFSQKLLKS